jgi:hypothetical protein
MAESSTIQVNPDQFLDPRWRLSNLYTITDKDGRAVRFAPLPAQLDFLDDIHSLNIILKARQLGFTTLCCLIYLDACVFTPNTRAGVIAHKLYDAKVIFRDKVKFPYDNLDEGLKNAVRATQDSADTLTFSNNSSMRVSTSMRSGTLQYLHISEFGKICAQHPEKAREIVTGALNAVAVGQFVAIESTAEGQDGAFYEMTQRAKERKASGVPLSPLDYKFHFYPWWEDATYALDDPRIVIDEDDERYFQETAERVLADPLLAPRWKPLTRAQKAWWVKKAETQGGDMKREYPATPDEAFEQALEGAYFAREIFVATKQQRIGSFPFDPKTPVNTFWDLGRNDLNTIWLHQYVKNYHRFIGYYENSGEHISHYIKWLRDWANERNAVFGEHYWPHDGDRESLWLEEGTLGVARGLKFEPQIVRRPSVKAEAISAARGIFASCQFDEQGAGQGLKRLRTYRKEWDDERGVWKDRPRHDDASHGADGFMTFACSNFAEMQPPAPRHAYQRRTRARHGTSEWAA